MFSRLACAHVRRDAVAVLVLVSLPVLLGIAVLTIDVGHMYNVRAELQTAIEGGSRIAIWTR